MPHKHNAGRRRHHHIPKMSFKVRNWPAYEAGLRRRGSLTLWIEDAALEPGFTLNPANLPTSFGGMVTVSGNTVDNMVGVLSGDVNSSWVPLDGSGNPITDFSTMPVSYYSALSAALGGVPLSLWGLLTPSGPLTVTGTSGNDTNYASPGATLTGARGTDTFKFLSAADSPVSAPNTITDFSTSLGDIIDLSAIDASDVAGGLPAFAFIGTATFSGAGQVRDFVNGGTTIVQGSIHGTGADIQINLVGSVALSAGSFKW